MNQNILVWYNNAINSDGIAFGVSKKDAHISEEINIHKQLIYQNEV